MKSEQATDAYQKALDYLYGFINFEHKRLDRYTASKLDPTRPQRLMVALGSPQARFPTIHVAGTKGKGSVAAMCAASLRAAGLKVGLFTSPHIQEFRERIRVLTSDDADGRISEVAFTRLMDQVKTVISHTPDITWFEILTAIAFLHFAGEEVDVAVIEVGLGGRLDATNVITPLVSVITSLSLDHTQLLGNSLAEIAYEKGGIIKPGIPVVTASQPSEALETLLNIAREREAPITVIGADWKYESGTYGLTDYQQKLVVTQTPDPGFIPENSTFALALAGSHQLENATVAIAALHVVQPYFPGLTLAAVKEGLATVSWSGRLQILHQGEETPTILVDCAHNVDSAIKLRHALTHEYLYDRLWLVFGATADKDVRGMLQQLLPIAYLTIATISSHPRGTNPDELMLLAAELGYDIMTAPTVEVAVASAWSLARSHDLICVTGSIFVVGDLLNQWESLKSQLLQYHHAAS